jgi:hypothetical protein
MLARVLDLDASLLGQPTLGSAVGRGEVRCVPLRDLAGRLRIVAARKTLREFERRVGLDDRVHSGRPSVDFVGSGDFHHLTARLLARFTEPLTVIHVDNHPDWVSWPRNFNCGGWVNRALDLPHVQQVITLGPCSADLDLPELKLGNLRALAAGRLEVYPWRHEPSRVFRRYGTGASHRTDNGHLVWTTLADKSWSVFVEALVARVPTEAVYLTIDKDALSATDAVTNWDQGEMVLEHVLILIERIAARRRLIGADVCGEYSPLRFSGWHRRLLSWLDRGTPAPIDPDACAQNERTNQRLLEAFSRCTP